MYLDQDLIAGLTRAYGERAAWLLSNSLAVFRPLEAMIDRVADDVRQRVAQHLDHLTVELDVAAVDRECDLLVRLRGKVPDHARQRCEEAIDPLHACAGDGIAKIGDRAGDALKAGGHVVG